MTGDTLSDGSLVGRIDGLSVAPSGALAFNLDVDDRERVPAMYTAATGTRILDPETLNSFYTIHSINSSNEVVFSGDVGDGWGFVRWDGSTVTSVLLGSDTVGGADVQAFRDAVITSQGNNLRPDRNDRKRIRRCRSLIGYRTHSGERHHCCDGEP